MIGVRDVGSLFICGFYGRTVTPELAELIDRWYVSSFVLYDLRNIAGAAQLRDLAGAIDRRCRRAGGVPALLAIDHEGGVNSQLRSAGTVFPGNLALAAGGGPAGATAAGAALGGELRAAGLHLNLAPVLDLYDPRNPGIGPRSFATDPGEVARFGAAYLRGLLGAGALAAAKHFPGNSVTDTDPHRGLPVVGKALRALWAEDLAPYRALMRAGLLPAVLTSHAMYPALDRRMPATLSAAVLTGLLRRRLGFRGAVLSDDLEMAAIERRHGLEGAVGLAVRAGVDLVMICHTYDKMRRGIAHLRELASRDPAVARRVRESAG
ncbi:MAG: glycoside hydrolase family 3 N-terminal domain-containing protein, partial [bacterium]